MVVYKKCICVYSACLPLWVHSSGYGRAEESRSLGYSDDSTPLQLEGRPQSAVAGYLPTTQTHKEIEQIMQRVWKTGVSGQNLAKKTIACKLFPAILNLNSLYCLQCNHWVI